MVTERLHESFGIIYKKLIDDGQKPTNIAKQMGYTSTTQLNNVLEGSSMLSTKAIISLIENLKVNPAFLFLGKGEMFVAENSIEENKQKEIERLTDELEDIRTFSEEQKNRIAELENLYSDLLKNTSKAMEYYTQSKIMRIKKILEEHTEIEKKEKQ